MARPAVEWTHVALSDLDEAAEYIARDSPVYAAILVRKVLRVSRSLADFPTSGHVVPEFDDSAIREVLVRPYRLIYTIQTDTIYVLGLIHAARDLTSAWRDEERHP